MAQLVEHCPVNKKVTGSIPGQGTHLGCGSVPGRGTYKRQLIDISLSHQRSSLPPFPSFSLKKKKKIHSISRPVCSEILSLGVSSGERGTISLKTPSLGEWVRDLRGDQEKHLDITTLRPLPFQTLLAALGEACHGDRSQLQIAFINKLQQLQAQPQPDGGNTSSQAIPSSDSEVLNALGLHSHFPGLEDPRLYPGPTLSSANASGKMSASQPLPGCFSQPSLKFAQQSRPNACHCSLR